MSTKHLITIKLLSVLVVAISAGWIWFTRLPAEAVSAIPLTAPRQGFLAPDFSLVSSTGETYDLTALRGRPIVINFWASWCLPCRTEMPAIEHIHQAYKDQGLIVLGINASSQDPVTNALAFVKENNLTFPVLFDQEAQAYELYAVRALPTTYFIAPDGKIQEVIVGGPISEALLRVRVQHLLAMPER